MILVTGATGQFGSRVVEGLLHRLPAERLGVSVRVPDKADGLRARGVEVRHGDFDDPASLDAAFAGVERLLVISTDGDNETRIRQHRNAVEAAERARVGFIAYTSLAGADSTTLSLGAVHRATEQAIRATGIPSSILRNNWYAENEAFAIKAVLAGGPIVTSAANGRIGWAARADYAEAAAAVLAGEGHENTCYELAGQPLGYDELAAVLSRILGRKVAVRHVDDATFATMLADAGLPPGLVAFLGDVHRAIRKGALDVTSDDLARLLGRPPTPMAAMLEGLVRAPERQDTAD